MKRQWNCPTIKLCKFNCPLPSPNKETFPPNIFITEKKYISPFPKCVVFFCCALNLYGLNFSWYSCKEKPVTDIHHLRILEHNLYSCYWGWFQYFKFTQCFLLLPIGCYFYHWSWITVQKTGRVSKTGIVSPGAFCWASQLKLGP